MSDIPVLVLDYDMKFIKEAIVVGFHLLSDQMPLSKAEMEQFNKAGMFESIVDLFTKELVTKNPTLDKRLVESMLRVYLHYARIHNTVH